MLPLDIRLIVTDMDGTLLDGERRLPRHFPAIANGLAERGIDWAIASGRQFANLRAPFDALGMHPDIIAENGALAVAGGEPTPFFRDLTPMAFFADVIGAARDAFEYVAGDYIETVGNVNLTSGVTLAASDNYSPKLNNDGTFEMTVSGIQLSKGQGNYQGTYVSLYDGTSFVGAVRVDWAASNNIKGWTWDVSKVIMPADTNGQITGEVTWVNTSTDGIYLNVAQRFCNLDIVFKYTGAKLTITYNMYYYFAGETVELITESGTEFSAQIPKDESTLFATITYEIKPASGKTLAKKQKVPIQRKRPPIHMAEAISRMKIMPK